MTTWLPIPGYEGLYEVSDAGEVKSLPRNTTRGGILKQYPAPPGYLTVKLWRDGVGTTRRVHSLVLAAHVGPRPDGLVTRHLDGNHLNNALSNLAYGTYRENNLDAVAHGANANTKKTHCQRGHPLDGENLIQSSTRRACRTCATATKRAWYLRQLNPLQEAP